MPTVSVIIPTYNRATLVTQAIDSVLQQTFKDYEIIVVDDGSTDNTENVLNAYSDHITYIKQKNKGVNAARNAGIKQASGKYIALLDNDDLWLDFKLQLEVEILDKYKEAGFVFSEFYLLHENGEKIPGGQNAWYVGEDRWKNIFVSSNDYIPCTFDAIHYLQKESVRLYFGDIYHQSLYQPCVLPSASLFRRSCSDNFLIFNESDSTCGDWEFFSLLSHQYPPVFIDIETACNRSHEDSVRLTRLNHEVQTRLRINQVNRIWKSDTQFYRENKLEVDQVLFYLLTELSKMQLFNKNAKLARLTLDELSDLNIKNSRFKIFLFKVLSIIPGHSLFLRSLRSLKHRLF